MASDPNSNANIDDVKTTHFSLDWVADFDACQLRGFALLRLTIQAESLGTVVLDTRDLDIASVTILADAPSDVTMAGEVHVPAWTLGERDDTFGSALRIPLPDGLRSQGTRLSVRIGYSTACGDKCSATQWLPAAQTAGKQFPYLFTQCQAIHARSLMPCQDSPGAKSTYDARVQVPCALVALMSATSCQDPAADGAKSSSSMRTFSFVQRVPIPPYLLALAVAELTGRDVGPRTTIWSEPSMVDAAAYEFAETEKYIAEAEAVCGAYEWGRYDVLCLPPSFPYGGMENPQLTFVTPTLLAGDRSLAQVVAHEVAHSWMGNLVTNQTWQHFWMNEGFTVFVERKILASISGAPLAQLHAILGYNALKDDVARLDSAGHADWTRLALSTEGVDPDDSFSRVPYEKGFHFLWYLERTLGEALFADFIKEHVASRRFGVVALPEWRRSLENFCTQRNDIEPGLAQKLASVDWEVWTTGTGMPPVEPPFDRSLLEQAEQEAARWCADAQVPDADIVAGWPVLQQMVFLDVLRERCDAELGSGSESRADNAQQHARWEALLQRLSSCAPFKGSRNAELRFRLGMLVASAAVAPLFGVIVTLLEEQGRMKFVRPLYRKLYGAGDEGRALAMSTFTRLRSSYHAIAQKMIASDLGL